MSIHKNQIRKEKFKRPFFNKDSFEISYKWTSIKWMKPFPLSKLNDESKKDFIKDNDYLNESGVYFLYWNKTNDTHYDSIKWEKYSKMIMSGDTIYIGKSGREKLKVRAIKHRKSLLGLPGVAPGKEMREIRKAMKAEYKDKVDDHILFFCGVVEDGVLPHLLEPIFGECYEDNHKRLPKANTQKFF
jgi:hypothetical protein